MYYDKEGNEITQEEWLTLFEADRLRSGLDGYYRVGLDRIDKVTVSTVWLGFNHNFSDYGPPLIFETMIFGGEHDQYCERYSTLEQAKTGHEFARILALGGKISEAGN